MKIGKILAGITTITAIAGTLYYAKKAINKSYNLVSRYRDYYDVTNQWLKNINQSKKTSNYFEENGYESIAIYGLGELGSRLYEELKESKINIKYFVDKEADNMYFGSEDVELVAIEDLNDDNIDAVVVTPVYAYNQIEKQLQNNGVTCDIISLEDVVYEL